MRAATPTPSSPTVNRYTQVNYQASGVQSFSTTATGSDTFALTGGALDGFLSLSNSGELYTIDEFDTNESGTDSSENLSGSDADMCDYGEISALSTGQAYSLSVEADGSLSEAGADSVASYSSAVEYASYAGSGWEYSGYGYDATTEGNGEAIIPMRHTGP